MATNPVDTIIVLGAELGFLGLATLIAASNEGVGNIIMVFMIGLLLVFLIYHSAFTGALPKLFTLGVQGG